MQNKNKQLGDLWAPSRPNTACGTLNHTQSFTVVIVGREVRNDMLCTTVPNKIKLKAGIYASKVKNFGKSKCTCVWL